MLHLLLFLLALCPSGALAEYVYPVAAASEQEVYVLYQKSIDHIELWLWNSITKKASKALLSTFSPAGLQLLPDGSGFSFIDNDRIRVKMQGRRQPRAVGFYEPIYDISLIHWIDHEAFYFSAKEKDHYTIFHGTIYGTCHRIISIKHGDCMYPQLRGSDLYFIERDDNNDYAIVSIPYPIIPHEECVPCTDPAQFEERVKAVMQERGEVAHRSYADPSKRSLVADFGKHPIAFLRMYSDTFGIVIEYPQAVNRSDAFIPFTCHALEHINNAWQTRALFSFDISTQLLMTGSPDRLYESILPLLPRFDGKETIFFVNTNKFRSGMNIHEFRLDARSIAERANNDENRGLFFSPLCSKFGNWYGGMLTMTDGLSSDQVCMYFDADGDVCFNLPSIP
jgi:hypothetical protein